MTTCGRGGGVLLAVDNNFKSCRLDLSTVNSQINNLIDVLGVKLMSAHITVYIFIVYIPPNFRAVDLETLFEQISSIKEIHNNNLIILGDLNIPGYLASLVSNQSNPQIMALNNFMNFLDLTQHNFIRNCNNRTLDLVISNCNCSVDVCKDILVPVDSHHPALEISVNVNVDNNMSLAGNFAGRYNFRKANFPGLYESILLTDWSMLQNFTDVDEACSALYSRLHEIFDQFVPKMSTYRHKRFYPAWFNAVIIANIRLKEKAWRAYRQTGDLNALANFKRLRATIKSDINISFKNYNQEIEKSININPNKFWSFVNSKRGSSDIACDMEYEGSPVHGSDNVVNAFADFFVKSYTKGQSIISANEGVLRVNSVLQMQYVNEDQVLRALRQIKPKFTTGPDGIPAFLVRDCANALAAPLLFLFNLSIQTSTFPACWKKAKVCPVFKKGKKTEITNFRPITIICNFAKVFECLLYEPLYCHVKHALSPQQHGFMKGRSTVTNLMCITQYIATSIDLHFQTDVVYTDFSKAFDRLNHDKLLFKLNQYGISDDLVNFFKSYLTDRSQYVFYRGFESVEYTASSGVPQGSILGPLFFNIFVNDIMDNLDVRCLMYADDLKIFSRITSIEDCLKIQSNLTKIYNWSIENDLTLNAQKCSVMSFTTKARELRYDYKIDRHILEKNETFKDLGVIFDKTLSFTSHMQTIEAEAYKALGFVIRNSHGFSDNDTIKLLYYAFVRPKLEYACLIWNPHYIIHINGIESIQRRLLKFLAFKSDKAYPPIGFPQEDLLLRFSLNSLESRRENFSLSFIHKLCQGKIDSCELLSYLHFHIPRITSRQENCFYLQTPRTNILKYSPIYQMCGYYNIHQHEMDIFLN